MQTINFARLHFRMTFYSSKSAVDSLKMEFVLSLCVRGWGRVDGEDWIAVLVEELVLLIGQRKHYRMFNTWYIYD